jgi:hypothetical protein
MPGLRLETVREHREDEARRGWPLLRACPNTFAIVRLAFLDRLSPDDRLEFARQLSDLEALEAQVPQRALESNDEYRERLERFPIAKAYLEDAEAGGRHSGIGKIPVKIIAGVRKDAAIGGIQGWAERNCMPSAHLIPPRPLAETLDDLVPVKPARLRKLVAGRVKEDFSADETRLSAEHVRYVGDVPGAKLALDITYARSGGRAAHQLEYHMWVKVGEGARIGPLGYESVWRTPSRWDYITESNAEACVDHLCGLIRCCIALA